MQLKFMHAAVVLSLLGGASGFAACSSSSSRSTTPKDGGADATADSDAAKPCTVNSECDDDDPCNGTETCDTGAGTCKAGTALCDNPDPAHCDVTCDFNPGLTCGVVARDGDGDTHGDALCQQAPGLDCDDTNLKVFPGANETCDGVDSDCDGKADVDDGFALGGTELTLVEQAATQVYAPSIAWAATAKKFGMTWRQGGHVWFGLLDESGTLSAVKQVSQGTEAQGASIASDGQNFAVVYDANDAGQFLAGRLYDSEGSPKTAPLKIALQSTSTDSRPQLTKNSDGWLLSFHAFDSVWVRKLKDDLSLDPAAELKLSAAGLAQFVAIAAGNTEHGLVYLPGYHPHDGISFSRVDATPTLIKTVSVDKALPATARFDESSIAWTGDGWVGAASGNGASGSIALFEAAENGTIRCGATAITGPKGPFRLGNLALNGSGRILPVVESAGPSGVAKLVRLDEKCTVLPSLELGAAAMPSFDAFFDRPFGPGISAAVGDTKIVVVWQGAKDGYFQVKARIFGKNFCD